MEDLIKIRDCWGGEPPKIRFISQALPNATCLPLSRSGCSNASLGDFLESLKRDRDRQSGKFFAYVKSKSGGCQEEADTYSLKSWEVYTSPESCYEALVILYYAPINEYLTIKKHLGEDWAQNYLNQLEKRQQAIASLENLI
jgi:hypothetical protein